MKDKQRKLLLERRGALNRSYIRHRSVIISKKIYEFLRKKRVIASYSPYNSESNPNLFFDSEFLYFPKVKGNNMSFCKGVLVKSFKGIREPKLAKRCLFKKFLDVIVVPGVGFDERGYRLGYGGGFYDRYLAGFKGLKVGVTFDCCFINRVDNTENDVPVDVVITEKRKIFCRLRR